MTVCGHCNVLITKKVMYWIEPKFNKNIQNPIPFCNHYCSVMWYKEHQS